MKMLGVLVCCTLACCGAAFAGIISLHPSATTVPLGTPVTIDVNVSGLSDLYAWQFDIDFNPAILSATNVPPEISSIFFELRLFSSAIQLNLLRSCAHNKELP